ncbi:MAG: signal peptidase I [Tannerellaceae bacterium]
MSRIRYIGAFLLCVLLVIIIRLFVGYPCYIPSDSMKKTLLTGDYVWLNRFTYGARLPQRFSDIPIINVFTWNNYLRTKDSLLCWPYRRIGGLNQPKRNDLVVFKHGYNRRELVVKRIVGMPGDTVGIIKGQVYINSKVYPSTKNIIKAQRAIETTFPSNSKWNTLNYGPIQVPYKGQCMVINDLNYTLIKDVVEKKGDLLIKDGNVFKYNGKLIKDYIFEEDCYFVLGDNRNNSIDSRFNGFVPEHNIEGKINWILFSLSIETDYPLVFRSDRLLKFVE